MGKGVTVGGYQNPSLAVETDCVVRSYAVGALG